MIGFNQESCRDLSVALQANDWKPMESVGFLVHYLWT